MINFVLAGVVTLKMRLTFLWIVRYLVRYGMMCVDG